MDLYRFFHPHHDPRLYSTPLRQQEFSEMEQAAAELLKSLERAKKRMHRKASPPLLPAHLNDIIKAMVFVSESLQTLCDAHNGDSEEDLRDLIRERHGLVGWENWTSLVDQQLAMSRAEKNVKINQILPSKKVVNG